MAANLHSDIEELLRAYTFMLYTWSCSRQKLCKQELKLQIPTKSVFSLLTIYLLPLGILKKIPELYVTFCFQTYTVHVVDKHGITGFI